MVALLSGGLPLHPATHTVCSSGCDFTSIQAAVDAAASGDTIEVGEGTFLENVLIEAKSLTVEGAARETTIVDGGHSGSVFLISTTDGIDVEARIAHMTVRNGSSSGVCADGWFSSGPLVSAVLDDLLIEKSSGSSCAGGGVTSLDAAQVTVSNSIIAGNLTPAWGAVVSWYGDLTITDSIIEGNQADGIFVWGATYDALPLDLSDSIVSGNSGHGILTQWGVVTVSNSTISGNVDHGLFFDYSTATVTSSTISGNTGAGIVSASPGYYGGTLVTVTDSTVAGNGEYGLWTGTGDYGASRLRFDGTIVAGNSPTDCANDRGDSLGHNLAGDASCDLDQPSDLESTDPLLLPLADNGGPTPTHALEAASPAIDTAGTGCSATDQRGFARPFDGDGDGSAHCDRGAVEFQGDEDGDTVEDPLDCAPADPDAWRLPGAVEDLLLEKDGVIALLSWLAPLDPGAVAPRYDTIRSELPDDFDAEGVCVEIDGEDTETTDSHVPPIVFHYLVRAENACGSGPGGHASDGSPRVLRACP
jgi:nitrous oxidase accessory protein NosD